MPAEVRHFKGLLGEAASRAVSAQHFIQDGDVVLDDFEVPECEGPVMFETSRQQAETLRWAALAADLNGAADSGRYEHITTEVVLRRVADGDVFEFLALELRTDVDLSQLTDVHRHTLLQHWRNFATVYETDQFHVTHSGLALLVAYLLHLIKIRHVAIPT